MTTSADQKKVTLSEMEAPQGWEAVFLSQFMQRRREMAHPVPPRPFYSQAQKQPCCFYPLGAPTHLPLPRPF